MTSHLMATSPWKPGIHARVPAVGVTAVCGVIIHQTSTFAYFDPTMAGTCPDCVRMTTGTAP